MKQSTAIVVLFVAASMCPAHALYCGNGLVNEGQQKFEVLQKCGEPAFADSRVVYVPSPGWPPRPPGASPYGHYGYGAPASIPVVIDEWVYNFGPTKMMPRLVFRDGVLWTIRYHGYGN